MLKTRQCQRHMMHGDGKAMRNVIDLNRFMGMHGSSP
jgi:hypothetical protein